MVTVSCGLEKPKDNDNNSTALTIPKEISLQLDIEKSKVSMSVLEDCDVDRHLLVTKHYRDHN
jgi:hypothetical protein